MDPRRAVDAAVVARGSRGCARTATRPRAPVATAAASATHRSPTSRHRAARHRRPIGWLAFSAAMSLKALTGSRSRAKKAAAFLRISFSCRSRAFSRRSRLSSSRSAARQPVVALAAVELLLLDPVDASTTPRSPAPARSRASIAHPVRASAIAPSRNSFGYGLGIWQHHPSRAVRRRLSSDVHESGGTPL